MTLTDRKKKILRAVVNRYVQTAEPVGSKAVLADCGLSVSPATIRSEMAELESMGYLEQPHTSAGRIPTAKCYRVYVNELMEKYKLSPEDTATINRALRSRVQQPEKVVSDAGRLTSQLTNYPAYAMTAAASSVTISRFELVGVDRGKFIIVVMLSNNSVKNKLVQLYEEIAPEFLTRLGALFNANFTGIDESAMTMKLIETVERAAGDRIGITAIIAAFAIEILMDAKTHETYVTGASHLLEHPEYRDVDKAQKVLSYLADDRELLKLPKPEASGSTRITIGPENLAEELKDSSVVVAQYDAGDGLRGLIGVVGPTRMDYSKVAARLSYIAQGLGWLLSGGFSLPDRDDSE